MNQAKAITPARNPFGDTPKGNTRPAERLQRQLMHNIEHQRTRWNEHAAQLAGASHSSRTKLRLNNNMLHFMQRVGLRWRNQVMLALAADDVISNAVCFNRLTTTEYLPVGVYEQRYSFDELCLRTATDYRERCAFAGLLVPVRDADEAAGMACRNTNNGLNGTEHDAHGILALRASKGKAYAQCEPCGAEAPYLKRYLLNPSLIPWTALEETARVLGRVYIDGEAIVCDGRMSEWAKCALPYALGVAEVYELKKWRVSPVHLTSIPYLKEKEKEAGHTSSAKAALIVEEKSVQVPANEPVTSLPELLEEKITGRGGAAPVENPVENPQPGTKNAYSLIEAYVSVLVKRNGNYDAQVLARSAQRALVNWDANMLPNLDAQKTAMILPAIANFDQYCAKSSAKFVPQQLPENFFKYNPTSGIFRAIQMLGKYEMQRAQKEQLEQKAREDRAARITNLTGVPIDRKLVDIIARDDRKGTDPRNRPFGFTASDGSIAEMYYPAGQKIATWILPRLREMHAGNKQAMYVLNQTADLDAWYDALLQMRHYAEALVSKTAGFAPGTVENFNVANQLVNNALAWWLSQPNAANLGTSAPGTEWFRDRKADYAAAAGWRKKFTLTGLVVDHATGTPMVEQFFASFLSAISGKNPNPTKFRYADWSLSYAKELATKTPQKLAAYVEMLTEKGNAVYYTKVTRDNPLGFTVVTREQMLAFRRNAAEGKAGSITGLAYHDAVQAALNGSIERASEVRVE
jgi:hypothetical protein